jgi:hypothetical protein
MCYVFRMFLCLAGACTLFPLVGRTQEAAGRANTICRTTSGKEQLTWERVHNTGPLKLKPAPGNTALPRQYQVYRINERRLKQFLKAAANNKGEPFRISLPVSDEIGCRIFDLNLSGTMSPELAKKFPELLSFKGTAVENKNANLRLDYDGQKMSAEITWNGEIYIMSAWKSGAVTYYLLFLKKDGAFKKIPFRSY